MRSFIAIELPAQVRSAIQNLLGELQRGRRGVKWCRTEQMHLTLKFFADLPEESVSPLDRAISKLCGATSPFDLSIRGLGTFGPRDRIRVIWAGVEDPSGALGRLQAEIERACGPLGFPPEGRPFSPHLTLGRLREPARDPALTEALHQRAHFHAGSFEVDHLALFHSTLTPSGPVYGTLRKWPLEVSP